MTTIAKNHLNTIDACRYCPMCRHACPSEFIRYRESDTPRGRAILLHNVYRAGTEFDASAIEAIYNCFLCGACKSWCAGYDLGGYDIPELIKFARRDIVNKGLAPAIVEKIKVSLVENENPYSLDINTSFSATSEEKPADILYYMGPEMNFKNHEIAKAAILIFEHLNIPFTILKQEPASGKILDLLGYRDEAIGKSKNLAGRIKNTGCKTLVVSDPLAYDAFKNDYPEWGIELENIKVVHLAEFLAVQLRQGKLQLKKISDKVTLADSEFLGRNNNIYEVPREVVKAAAGAHFVEMQWNREYMQSAGEAAFVFDSEMFGEGNELGEKISQKAESAGAEIIVTLSATAKNNITAGSNLKVLDLVEFVAEVINPD